MNKLNELISKCKVSVTIYINEHREFNESVSEYVDDDKYRYPVENLHPDILNKMIELDTIVQIVIYPETPIPFYDIWHYDLDLAIDEALEYLKDK